MDEVPIGKGGHRRRATANVDAGDAEAALLLVRRGERTGIGRGDQRPHVEIAALDHQHQVADRRLVGGHGVHVGRKARRRHAARVMAAGSAVDTEADPVEMYQRPSFALGEGVTAGHQPVDVVGAHDAAGDVDGSGEVRRLQAPARHRHEHFFERQARRALGLRDGGTHRRLGLGEIGDDARP